MKRIIILVISCLTFSGTIENRRMDSIASVYSNKFQNRKTASGARFDQRKLTCAYNQIPLGTKVRITRIIEEDTYSVEVLVNDRISKKYSHRIDLSKKAAQELKIIDLAPVIIEVL